MFIQQEHLKLRAIIKGIRQCTALSVQFRILIFYHVCIIPSCAKIPVQCMLLAGETLCHA